MHYKDSDAGHFVPGRGNEVLFDDAHIFPQCQGCNFDGGGEQYKYGLFLKKKYGYTDQIIDEIINKRHKVKKFSLSELKEIKISFDLEIKRLKEKKGIK